ncbi:MAG: hypothetical protein H6R12_935 [Proteobacteria bacterium]|nr:hypothetical protein [Pseudomonadota bacterium]
MKLIQILTTGMLTLSLLAGGALAETRRRAG